MDDLEDTQSFNFYLELSKPQVYDSLVLGRTLTLVLAMLYQRERSANSNNEVNGAFIFTEEDIHECLRQVVPTEQRVQHERYNQFIRDLQTHFLWRDEETGRYRFKEYARNFYGLMYDRLEQKFQPTYAKHIFNKLIDSLNDVLRQIDAEPNGFNHWIDYDFENSRINISNQVEILYNKVDDAVQLLRDEVRPEADDFLTTLRHAEQRLDALMKDADELNHIFHASRAIRQGLNELQRKLYMEELDNHISQVSAFLDDTDDKLRLVRQRIRKIRPHIQRLFNVQQREFDMNTGKFLAYLLAKSQIVNQDGTKRLEFPKSIDDKFLFQKRLTFTRINKQTFLPSKAIQVERPKISKEVRQKQQQDYEQNLERRKQVQTWLEVIDLKLEAQGKIVFSNIFYQILDSQVDGTATALEVAQRLLSCYTLLPEYHVKIGNIVRKQTHPNHTICEITIQKLPHSLS